MRHMLLAATLLISISGSTGTADESIPTDFKSAEINAEIKKIPELETSLRSLMEARMKVARGELIDKLKAYQTKATQDGDLEEALKVRDTIADLEKLQAAQEKFAAAQAPAKPAKVNVPKNAVRFGKSRYYLVTDPKTWAEAKKLCEEQGGHLARIESVEEHTFCAKLIQAYRPTKKNDLWVWIDGTDEALEGTFVYSNGKEVEYVKWDVMKPNATSTFNWLSLDVTTGLFHDAGTEKRPFICEWD